VAAVEIVPVPGAQFEEILASASPIGCGDDQGARAADDGRRGGGPLQRRVRRGEARPSELPQRVPAAGLGHPGRNHRAGDLRPSPRHIARQHGTWTSVPEPKYANIPSGTLRPRVPADCASEFANSRETQMPERTRTTAGKPIGMRNPADEQGNSRLIRLAEADPSITAPNGSICTQRVPIADYLARHSYSAGSMYCDCAQRNGSGVTHCSCGKVSLRALSWRVSTSAVPGYGGGRQPRTGRGRSVRRGSLQSDGFMGSRRARMRVSLITISAPAVRSSAICWRFARTTAVSGSARLSARRRRMTLGARTGALARSSPKSVSAERRIRFSRSAKAMICSSGWPPRPSS